MNIENINIFINWTVYIQLEILIRSELEEKKSRDMKEQDEGVCVYIYIYIYTHTQWIDIERQ